MRAAVRTRVCIDVAKDGSHSGHVLAQHIADGIVVAAIEVVAPRNYQLGAPTVAVVEADGAQRGNACVRFITAARACSEAATTARYIHAGDWARPAPASKTCAADLCAVVIEVSR